jgi:hypothetical protein
MCLPRLWNEARFYFEIGRRPRLSLTERKLGERDGDAKAYGTSTKFRVWGVAEMVTVDGGAA